MKGLFKNSMSLFLTVLSLGLLAIFLVLWNRANYHKESDQLSKEISSILARAYNDVKDAYFLDDLIPSMKKTWGYGSSKDSIQVDLSISTQQNYPVDIQFFAFLDAMQEDSMEQEIFIDMHGDTCDPKGAMSISRLYVQENKNSQIRWMYDTVFDAHTNVQYSFDTIHSDSVQPSFFQSLIRPKFVKEDEIFRQFDRYLRENDLDVQYLIVEEETSDYAHVIRHQTRILGDRILMIDIINFNRLVFQKLYKAFLFSLLLFGITAWAFWTLFLHKRKQQHLVDMKNEFIGNMTHELKTPISTVGVALEAISTLGVSLSEEKRKEYVDISRNELQRLSLLVDKVLKMASFDNDEVLLKKETIDINESVHQILNSMKLQLQEKQVKWTLEENAQAIISGDPVHVSNVIYNILDNAMKYSEQNPKIDILIDEEEDFYKIEFKDHGKGIPREYQDKVFDRFFRLPSNDHHNVKGHGLGLSYVRDVIVKHDGRIELQSVLGEGSTFIIRLPKYTGHV